MTIHEKLERLLETQNLTKLCGKVDGLKPAAVANILTRKSVPKSDTALRLARALAVDPGWLIDDTQSWPPVRTEKREAIAA